jgi:SET domain-containing protein
MFQVFLTPEGKGWGLRTLEELPRGAFVCEYVGEIITSSELHERNLQSSGNENHTYSVPLDANWGTKRHLKDEEALYLDATAYGNVARFINHRYSCNVCCTCHLCAFKSVCSCHYSFSQCILVTIFVAKVIPLLCLVLALYTESGVRFLDEFPLSNLDLA